MPPKDLIEQFCQQNSQHKIRFKIQRTNQNASNQRSILLSRKCIKWSGPGSNQVISNIIDSLFTLVVTLCIVDQYNVLEWWRLTIMDSITVQMVSSFTGFYQKICFSLHLCWILTRQIGDQGKFYATQLLQTFWLDPKYFQPIKMLEKIV